MKWKNLLNDDCPKCGCNLVYKKDSELYECALYDEDPKGHFSCDFSISPPKKAELVRKITTGRMLNEFDHDNLKDLNNLGL